MRRSQGYKRVECNNLIKIAIVVVLTVAIVYYGIIGVKCIKHYQALMNNHVATINLNIND